MARQGRGQYRVHGMERSKSSTLKPPLVTRRCLTLRGSAGEARTPEAPPHPAPAPPSPPQTRLWPHPTPNLSPAPSSHAPKARKQKLLSLHPTLQRERDSGDSALLGSQPVRAVPAGAMSRNLRTALIFGGFFSLVGAAFYPIYFRPLTRLEEYRE